MGIGDPNAGGEINLARAEPLRLGRLTVVPATRQADWGQGAVTLEPRVIQVLIALAERRGVVVSRDELIDRCWKGQVVGDNAIQRAISQLRRLSADVGAPGFEIETIARVGYRLSAPKVGLAAAPNVERANREDAGEGILAPPPVRTVKAMRWRVALAATGFLILAAGAAIIWRIASPLPSSQTSRVDVMTFTSQGSDPALPKVTADLSETIVRVLAGVGVPVALHSTGQGDTPGGSDLRIAGTVAREGSDFVFNTQILDRKTGVVLWSTRMVRGAREEATSPGDPAFRIAAVLHCAIADRQRSRTSLSTEAFGLYLNACAGIFDHTGGTARMLAVTRQLTQAAPNFAGAHAMHAIAAAFAAGETEHSPAQAATLHAESNAEASQALTLDPNTPKAYAALALNAGALSDRPDQDRVLEERYIRQALKLDPDLPPARSEYALLLRSVGRINEAADFMRATDPMDPRNLGDQRLALLLASKGDMAGAEALLTQIESATRSSQNSIRWTIAVWWEDPKTALPKVESLANNDTSQDDINCLTSYLKELDSRRAAKARGLPPSCATLDPAWRVRLLAREGDVDGVFAAMGGAMPANSLVLFYPEMRAVRADARFWPLAARFGLTDYWTRSGHWPDFCAEPDPPKGCPQAAGR